MTLTLKQEEFAALLGLEYNPEEASTREILDAIDMLLRECFDLSLAGGAEPPAKVTEFSQDQMSFFKVLDFDFDLDEVPANDLWNLVQMYVHDTYGVDIEPEDDAPVAEEPTLDQPTEAAAEALAAGVGVSDYSMPLLGARKPTASISDMMSHDII